MGVLDLNLFILSVSVAEMCHLMDHMVKVQLFALQVDIITLLLCIYLCVDASYVHQKERTQPRLLRSFVDCLVDYLHL